MQEMKEATSSVQESPVPKIDWEHSKPTFKGQFRAVFLKNVSEEFRQKKLLTCQILIPTLLILIVLVVELIIGDYPDLSNDNSYSYVYNILPYSDSYYPFYIAHEPNGASSSMIGRAPNSTGKTCTEGRYEGLLGYEYQHYYTYWNDWFNYNHSLGGCTPHYIQFGSWDSAIQEYKRAQLLREDYWNKHYSDRDEKTTKDYYEAPYAILTFPSIEMNKDKVVLNYTIYTNEDLYFAQGQASYAVFTHEKMLRMIENYTFDDSNQSEHYSYVPRKRINAGYQEFSNFPDVFFSYKAIDVQLQMFLIVMALFCQIPFLMYKAVLERQTGLMEMIEMMGMRLATYWISNFLHDLIIYYFVLTIIYTLSFASGIKLISDSWMVPIILLLWGPSQIAISYVFSCFFRKTSTAVVMGYLLILAFLGAGYGLCFGVFLGNSTPPFYYMFFPPFALMYGIWCAGRFICNPSYLVFYSENIAQYQVGISIIYFFFFGIIFLLLAVFLDPILPKKVGQRKPIYWPIRALVNHIKNRTSSPFKRHMLTENPEETAIPMAGDDEDCRKEIEVVRNEQTIANSAILISNLTKIFGSGATKVKALQGVSFHIEKGECFGLLGPNGAGKTTLVNILSGLTRSDSGNGFVQGIDINEDIGRIQRMIGLCPQFDILCDDLTVREHLLFYSRLKGCPHSVESNHVETLINEVGLQNERRRLAKDLSGGQKRRLSLAIALTGNPPVVFLDEPSSGLDPGCTREIWDVLLKARIGRCFLLTTHSMIEADTIATRIGILSQGRLKCIGSQQHLKSKYGSGYKCDIFTSPDQSNEAEAFFLSIAKGAEIVSKSQNALVFRLPKETVLSELFTHVDAEKYRHGIKSWSIAQSSLDEVFISIVKADETEQSPSQSQQATPTV